MLFSTLAHYLNTIEETSARNEITVHLSELFGEANTVEIGKICYLTLGNLGPAYSRKEFGISQKLLLKSLVRATEKEGLLVDASNKSLGDIGAVAFELFKENHDTGLTVEEVFDALNEVASVQGVGSQGKKIDALTHVFKSVDCLSAKYIARILVQKLRLGFSEMTILDGLSYMLAGDKSYRPELERAFNVRADIGFIASCVRERGIGALAKVSIEVGVPIRPAAAERMPTAASIIEKLGTVAAEPKIDGFRVQVHYRKNVGVWIFSRNLENMSDMFPEVVEAVEKLRVESIVFEGEAVALDSETGEMLPFQETMQRRRKHGIKQMSEDLPLSVFCFDILYLNGESHLLTQYKRRREVLAECIGNKQSTLTLIEEDVFRAGEELSKYFNDQLKKGFEGIVTKRLDGLYAAGQRNNNWVKLKREDGDGLNDTIDCVVMGYKYGKGKRNVFGIGAFLVGVYDTKTQMYRTISNVGTGLTDEQWVEMKRRSDKLQVNKKPKQYDVPAGLEQDVWVEPGMVVEILADTITRSPNHTAGKVEDEAGYALRFPRLVTWRDDKSPEQATSVEEIVALYGR